MISHCFKHTVIFSSIFLNVIRWYLLFRNWIRAHWLWQYRLSKYIWKISDDAWGFVALREYQSKHCRWRVSRKVMLLTEWSGLVLITFLTKVVSTQCSMDAENMAAILKASFSMCMFRNDDVLITIETYIESVMQSFDVLLLVWQ